jgi:uncharacterized protein YhfF
MAEEGTDLAAVQPQVLTDAAVKAADVVITMGCEDACPFFPSPFRVGGGRSPGALPKGYGLPMTWPRVEGLRALELGSPGEMRARLIDLVLKGRKRATAGLLQEYEEESEALEHVGERLALIDDEGRRVATVEVTSVDVVSFGDVDWDFASAEGEGHRDLDAWRTGHQRFWAADGYVVDEETTTVLLRFTVVPTARDEPQEPSAVD